MGYIYFNAPDIFEKDPVKTYAFGGIRRDEKKAKELFKKASTLGSVNAMYNMGCFHMSSHT